MKKNCFLIIINCLWIVIINCAVSEDGNLYENSQYVLPYPVGNTYMCWQGRFYGGYNRGKLHFAQDFAMPVNTIVTAARDGTVFWKREDVDENTGSDSVVNEVIISHDDGTFARYVHLAKNGVYVEINQSVTQGDTLAVTGNTGNVGPEPHLHFDVISDHPTQGINAQTIPVWFKNTKPHPYGVVTGEYYTAEEY